MNNREMMIELVEKFQITAFMAEQVITALRENSEMPDGAYEIFFDYYCSNGDMPYGTASGKDGDPIEWVYDTVAGELGMAK